MGRYRMKISSKTPAAKTKIGIKKWLSVAMVFRVCISAF
jgi:hypothetical protein